MAGSKVDAQAFKDNYTNSLIQLGKNPQITPQAEANFGRMPEQDLGEIAGALINTDNRTVELINDGHDRTYITDGNRVNVYQNPAYANPDNTKGHYAPSTVIRPGMSSGVPYEAQQSARRMLNQANTVLSGDKPMLAAPNYMPMAPSQIQDDFFIGGSPRYRKLKSTFGHLR